MSKSSFDGIISRVKKSNRMMIMTLNYKPLWIQLVKKNIKKVEVIRIAGLTTNVMANMGKNKPITMKNSEKICKALDCTPNDVFSFDDNYGNKNE